MDFTEDLSLLESSVELVAVDSMISLNLFELIIESTELTVNSMIDLSLLESIIELRGSKKDILCWWLETGGIPVLISNTEVKSGTGDDTLNGESSYSPTQSSFFFNFSVCYNGIYEW